MADDEPIYISANVLAATRVLSLEARGLLLELILHAGAVRSKTLAVDIAFLRSLVTQGDDQLNAQRHFDEIVSKAFVREVQPGIYLIAPGLWGFEEDMQKPDRPTLV